MLTVVPQWTKYKLTHNPDKASVLTPEAMSMSLMKGAHTLKN